MKLTPLAGIILLTATYAVLNSILFYYGNYSTNLTDVVWQYGFPVCLAWWVHMDRFYSKKDAPYEYLAFMYFAWVLLLPWYLFKSRGWKGILMYSGFLGLSYFPYFLSLAVFYLDL